MNQACGLGLGWPNLRREPEACFLRPHRRYILGDLAVTENFDRGATIVRAAEEAEVFDGREPAFGGWDDVIVPHSVDPT